MKHVSYKIITVLLLLTIFYGELGYYFFYSVRQIQIKKQVKIELSGTVPLAKLEMIELDANIQSIHWVEEGKEFLLYGQLYDVQKKVTTNGRTILHCLKDKKEAKVLTALGDAAHSSSDKQGDKAPLKVKIDYCIVEVPEKITTPSEESNQHFFHFNEAALTVAKEITVPPPRA